MRVIVIEGPMLIAVFLVQKYIPQIIVGEEQLESLPLEVSTITGNKEKSGTS
jgi:predicted aspartyl protease